MNGAATQIAARQFDSDFFKLPSAIQERIQKKIDLMGSRLADFPHYRMIESEHCRLRIGDYRIIYSFDPSKNEIYLVAIGHRREIYRS
jgi:mRNA interferase RelE/StbE